MDARVAQLEPRTAFWPLAGQAQSGLGVVCMTVYILFSVMPMFVCQLVFYIFNLQMLTYLIQPLDAYASITAYCWLQLNACNNLTGSGVSFNRLHAKVN